MKKIILGLVLCVALMACAACSSEKQATVPATEKQTNVPANDSKTVKTYANLMYAVQGETSANAKYKAFAEVADKEGYKGIAKVFRVLADAELKHADDEYALAVKIKDTERPKAAEVKPGTTIENLKAAIAGETEEYTNMYPPFVEQASKDKMPEAVIIFNYAKDAEKVHAGIYKDLLDNINNFDEAKYKTLYRCPVCGDIFTSKPESCPICNISGNTMVVYQ